MQGYDYFLPGEFIMQGVSNHDVAQNILITCRYYNIEIYWHFTQTVTLSLKNEFGFIFHLFISTVKGLHIRYAALYRVEVGDIIHSSCVH